MEMEKAAKEAEAAHIPGGVWVWLPDRRCLVDQAVAASYREKNPLPESLQPPCNSPPQGFLESFEGASPVVFRGSFKRGLSEDEIQERTVVLLSGNVLPLNKDCDTRDAKRRRFQAQAQAIRRWETMGHTQRRQGIPDT